MRHSTVLDNYIHTAFTRIANRGDGYPQWQAASGNIYCVSSHCHSIYGHMAKCM